MHKTNLIVISMLATVFLCSGFLAFAAAEEGTDSVPPDPSIIPDQPQPSDNSTRTPDDGQTYHILDDQTPLIAPAPTGAEGNLIATNTASPDNTLPIIGLAVALVAIVFGAVGVVYYRKHAKAEE